MTSKPIFGSRPFGKRDARLLMIAYFDPNGIETIPQSIEAWQRHSRHEIVLFNLWPGRQGQVRLPATLVLKEFDGAIVHPTVSYNPSIVEGLDGLLERGFAEFEGVKILMKQDEQVLSGLLPNLVRSKGFDLVMTCVPSHEQEKVYPRAAIGTAILFQTLTGYVAPTMRERFMQRKKKFNLTYRGSLQPLAFGRLGYEKRGIGYDVSALLSNSRDISFDISSRWEDRLSGVAWDEFLAASHVVLGVESGSNIFDFEGEVVAFCASYKEAHKSEDPWTRGYYDRAHAEFLHRFEDNVDYAQISPRHFEAASMGAAQLLYEGRYSGIFQPNEHYFPLRRDLTNSDAVIDFLKDKVAQQRMAERAFEEIVLEPRYWYETFISEADDAIDERLIAKGRHVKRSRLEVRPTAYILSTDEPVDDTKTLSLFSSLSASHDIVSIGMFPDETKSLMPSLERMNDRTTVLRLRRMDHHAEWIPSMSQLERYPSEGRSLLAVLVGCLGAPADVLASRMGADIAVESELEAFRDRCRCIVESNSTLMAAVSNLGAPDVIVASDLGSLFASVACGHEFGSQIVYDARTSSRPLHSDLQHWEIEFWQVIERRLIACCTIRLAATLLGAERMAQLYGQPFSVAADSGAFAAVSSSKADEPDFRWVDRSPLEPTFPRSAPPIPPSVFGNPPGRHLTDLALAAYGASIVDSSPFHARPNDADAVLRDESGGYAAALANSERPHWFEIDLGQAKIVGALEIEFHAGSIARDFFVLCRERRDEPWRILIEYSRNFSQRVREKFHAGTARFVRMIAFSFLGAQQRLLVSSFHVFGTSTGAGPAGQTMTGRQQEQLGTLIMQDVAKHEFGSRVLASSPFHPAPNDAEAVLRKAAEGYAGAIDDSSLPHWFTIDLGKERSIGAIGVRFLDDTNSASEFRISYNNNPDEPWHCLIEHRDHIGEKATDLINPVIARFLKFEAFAFNGQQRLLLSSIHAYEMLSDQTPVRGPSATPSYTEEAARHP